MIFVTGGAGYIDSHTCVELLDAGADVTVLTTSLIAIPKHWRGWSESRLEF